MHLPANASENLQFLTAEVRTQCLTLRSAIDRGDASRIRRIVERSGYAANLKQRIQSGCLTALSGVQDDKIASLRLATVADIAHQLERITDKFRDLSRQYLAIDTCADMSLRGFRPPLARLHTGLDGLADELPPNNGERAMTLAACAQRIDKQARKLHEGFVDELKAHPKQAADLSRCVLMAHALHQAGEAVARISEHLLSLQLGQSMSFDRFQSLQAMIDRYPELAGAAVSNLAETRSGSAISGLTPSHQHQPAAVFKDGLRQKLKEERKGVESWHELYPGLAPKILAYRKRGESAALLIEHLPGFTIEQLLLREPEALCEDGTKALFKTLQDVWRATRSNTPISAQFMTQILERLPDIQAVHNELFSDTLRIGHYRQLPFEQLVKRAAKLERALPSPFSVYIHGDFNVDNVIYDPDSGRIHFIDLHRSQYMDYLQDVSVFMVSCCRLPIRDPNISERAQSVMLAMDRAARRFARQQEDDHYDVRLALGLARSLTTSIRFMADRHQARRFIERARWLLERVLDTPSQRVTDFKLPLKELFRDIHSA